MTDDPVIDGVRRARCAISREFDNDPARLVAHYAELQARYKGVLVAGPEAGNDAAQLAIAADGSPSVGPPLRSGPPSGARS